MEGLLRNPPFFKQVPNWPCPNGLEPWIGTRVKGTHSETNRPARTSDAQEPLEALASQDVRLRRKVDLGMGEN